MTTEYLLRLCICPNPANRSTEDTICTALYSVFTRLENKNSFVRMLLVDFSSACNTVTHGADWLEYHTLQLDFLTIRPQTVQLAVTPRLH